MDTSLIRISGLPSTCVQGLKRRVSSCILAQKGFGSKTTKKATDETKKKIKNTSLSQPGPVPQNFSTKQLPLINTLTQDTPSAESDENFLERLASLKEQTKSIKSIKSAKPEIVSENALFASPPTRDIYANPPSVTDTLLGGLNSNVSDPALKSANIGPNQVAIAFGAVVFGVVFVAVSGIDLAGGSRSRTPAPAQAPPSRVQKEKLEEDIKDLERQYKQNPKDFEALEALAVSYAQIYDFKRSAELLKELAANQPSADVFRLLGETSLLSSKPADAIQAYKRAIEYDPKSFQIITGLVDAYVSNNQHKEAVDYLNSLISSSQDTVQERKSAAEQSGSSSPTEESSEKQESTAATSDDIVLDKVILQLLKAKTYGKWRGHENDALTTYEEVIKGNPEDFRGYLYKGRYLKEQGRRGDAERMFMQAKFYAPNDKQALVERLSNVNPIINLPDDS